MSTNTGALLDSCNFKFLNIKINDISITENYIADLSIDWNDKFRIYGFFTLNDHFDIVNTMLKKPGQLMIIEYIDNFDVKFKRSFNIVSSTESKEQDSKTVVIRFQDSISFLLQKTFINKSYKSVSLPKIVKDYFELECKPFIKDYNLKIHEDTFINLTNFVVPKHEDFLSFIEKEFNKQGKYFYQLKDKIIFGNNYLIKETPEYPYTQTGSLDLYGFKIIEYDLTYNNIRKTQEVQKADVQVYDKSTKSIKKYTKCVLDFMEDFNTGGSVINSQLTYGTQLKMKEYLIDTNEFDSIIFKHNTEMHIIVPGNINFSLIYKNVDVKISGANYTIETRETGDVSLSGKYQICRVEDKFISGQKFIQRLTLRRVNEGKPL